MRFKMLAAAAILASALPAIVHAQVVVSNPTTNTVVGVNNSNFSGQTFTSPGGTLASVTVQVTTVNNAGGSYRFSIYNFNTGLNSLGTALAGATFTPSATGAVTFSNLNVSTSAGNSYAFLFTPFGASPGTTEIYFAASDNAAFSGGNYFAQSNTANPSGQGVASSSTVDFTFSATFDAATPEPASWAMMIGGFGVVGGALRMRRRQAGAANLA